MKKFLLTLTIVICLILGVGIISASAANITGSCGDDVTYSLNTYTRVLTISGSGAMDDYTSSSSVPWYSYRSHIKTVVIEDGVTSIGSDAFYYCDSLTSITIGDSVTSIGRYAFSNCDSLTSITIGDSVTSIGEYAFSNCDSLTSITIGDSVTSIGEYAFSNCDSLTSITIGDSVTSIGRYAFKGCVGLTEIVVGENNANYSSVDGILFNKDKTTLIQYPEGKNNTTYTIPDSVTSIGSYAFYYCSSLTSITIPDSVTSIGDSAFSNCDNLTSVTIPDSVTSIGSSAFHNCDSLTSITIPDSVTSIGSYAFYYCDNLTSITIPDSVTSIGSYAFYYCSSLTSITIPDSVTSIGSSAFAGCVGLTEIVVDENNEYYCSVDGVLFNKDKTTIIQYPAGKTNSTYTIPDSVTSIGSYAFSHRDNLTSITIPDSVTSIGSSAFYDCSSLTSITIPDSVTSIGDSAFSYCSSLTSITIPDSVTSIGIYAFSYCSSLTSITIPDSVTSIGSSAFSNCSSLTVICYKGGESDWQAVSIGNNNYNLTDAYFIYSSGTCGRGLTWSVDEETGTLTISGEGVMDNYSEAELAPWSDVSEYVDITNIVIEGSVSRIGSYAFYNLVSVKTITIPKSVTDIEQYAFDGCDKLGKAYYAGSESEWSEVFISRTGNENLTVYTTVIYDSETEDEPTIPDTEGKTPEIGKTTFTFTPVGVNKGDIIAVLVVKDGVSTSYAKTYSGSGTVTFEIEDGFNSIKILVWDSYESMEPLMEEYATIE